MKIINLGRSVFKDCERTTTPKVLLNICDYIVYGLTDSNFFYRNYYIDPPNDYKIHDHKLGDVFYSKILSYHIMANMVCVKMPKTTYNMNPFKIDIFRKCCENLKDFVVKNDIKEIHTPIFGTKILEGDWSLILRTIQEFFENSCVERVYVYE